jgi:hypothetical protein
VENASAFARWKQLRLAVADHLEDVRLQPEELEPLVSALLGRAYKMQTGQVGLEALRSELLQNVLDELHREDVASWDKYRNYDRLADALRQIYKSQAGVLRVPEIAADGASPTDVLQALIEHVAASTLAADVEPWQRQELARVGIELRAIDYDATSDLERQVLLERSWLRLLMVRTAIHRPPRRADAARVLTNVLEQDSRAANVMHQLRDGQLAILKMWVLHELPE